MKDFHLRYILGCQVWVVSEVEEVLELVDTEGCAHPGELDLDFLSKVNNLIFELEANEKSIFSEESSATVARVGSGGMEDEQWSLLMENHPGDHAL